MGSSFILPTGQDQPPEIPPVTTPDIKDRGKSIGLGLIEAGTFESFWAALFAGLVKALQVVLTILAGVFDDIAALMTEFFTAAQGQDTPGFNRLVAAVLSDTLGVEVSAEDLQKAQFEGGRVAAMNRVGADLFNVLGNEFTGAGATAEPGAGIGGLPGVPGVQLTPEQGVKAAQSFLGFALSFAVRQGNVAFLSSALPWEWLSGIREYGEMMAKNLGLGRLVRRALQPYIQTLIATPLQKALNEQYRPTSLDPKQLASAVIRQDITLDDYKKRLAGHGYTDDDANIITADTYTRLNVGEIFILHETGAITDDDYLRRAQILGYKPEDVPFLREARTIELVKTIDRAYITTAVTDLHHGLINLDTFNTDVDATVLTREEKDAFKRNGANRAAARNRLLSINFLKKAYLNASITLDEYLAHAKELGYSQDDIDILEQELLVEQKQAADKIKAKKAKPPKPPKGGGTGTPPATGP